ncbi:MAG TPA: NTP transferase domain-containing protein [Acidobacteriota bacterium]|nr:NTP transferase domain-containing protein [Acidobacteriota bacterium]
MNAPLTRKAAVVLAAGKGKRMKSDLPKVLHTIKGRPMIAILLDTLVQTQFDRIIVVIGHEGEQVRAALAGYPVQFVWQRRQLGTGDAVKKTGELLGDFEGTTFVTVGDVPFLSGRSIRGLLDQHEACHATATCLSAIPADPKQYGRIVRHGDSDRLEAIIEYKDASEDIRSIREVNTGIFCFDNRRLFEALDEIRNDNVQREYYLTDVIKILHDKGLAVHVVPVSNPDEAEGINSVEELQNLARIFDARLSD